MNTATHQKRLDNIETHLTPKEWAIRLADEYRSFSSPLDCLKAWAERTFDELPMRKPYFALESLACERHPGRNPEDIRARNRLTNALWNEFRTLQLLLRNVSMTVLQKVENTAMEAALRLSALHSLIEQDAYGCAVVQAGAWIEKHKPAIAAEEGERQTLLKELAAFRQAAIGVTSFDSVPTWSFLGYPSPLEEWARETTALLKDFYAHRAAVELVQDDHFDRHPILFLDVEAELAATTHAIENAVATFNEYLKRRTEFSNADSKPEGCEGTLAIAVESIKASVKSRAVAIAKDWLRQAKEDAEGMTPERLERWREELGVIS